MGFWALAVPLIGRALSAAAITSAAGSMWHWSGENIEQTGIISEDQRKQLAYQYERLRWEQDQWNEKQLARDEDYTRSLQQTAMIAGFDQQQMMFQSGQQQSRLNFEASKINMQQKMLEQDRNTFLANQAFQAYSQKYNDQNNDRFVLAFILTELQDIQRKSQSSMNIDEIYSFEEPYTEDYTFDNFLPDYEEN